MVGSEAGAPSFSQQSAAGAVVRATWSGEAIGGVGSRWQPTTVSPRAPRLQAPPNAHPPCKRNDRSLMEFSEPQPSISGPHPNWPGLITLCPALCTGPVVGVRGYCLEDHLFHLIPQQAYRVAAHADVVDPGVGR